MITSIPNLVFGRGDPTDTETNESTWEFDLTPFI